MNLNIENTRKALQEFNFKTLFVEELGWSNPASGKIINENIKEVAFARQPIAELSGAVVFEITTPNGEVPEPKQRLAIAKEIQKQHFEHVLIFVDKDRKESIWHWLKNQDKKMVSREHSYFRTQPGDGFMAKISALVVDISEFDKTGNIAIAEVANRIKSALDIERVVKKFYRDYQTEYIAFLNLIEGIENDADRRWYASVILNRLMFIYFLQKKMFLNNGNTDYLNGKLDYAKKELGNNKYYEIFLSKLFFEGFAKQENQRSPDTNQLLGKIKYLNGGLFLLHKIELKYQGKIKIPDVAFENLFALFNRYSWTLDDTPGGADNEMNPDVLGYIFEKYINQKAFGAYYTRTEITEYLCEQTIYKLILDEVNEGVEKPYDTIADLLLHLNATTCRKLVVGEDAVLPNLSLLDPACGSGAFLVAAMKTLINVYAAILGKIEFLGNKDLSDWKRNIEQNHPSINYYIKKQIITHNLFGVDLMEEATEIAKLRLFLALVASAETVEQLEPLPNIDFNIMSGNSLIGLMRVDESLFNKHQKGDLFKTSYRDLVCHKEKLIRQFKELESAGDVIQGKKECIDEMKAHANETLNLMLGDEFKNLGIKYEQVTWDETKNKEGKPLKRAITVKDMEALEPFHWGYEFSEIFRKKDGFDAIITNPPWEVFQTDEKEFFRQFDYQIKKKKLRIEDWQKQMKRLMLDEEIKQAWLDFASKYPFQSLYFKKSEQYKNLLSGKLNLYTLFTIQCFNLLKKQGYCGIVIPSGIYTDLGTKQLREMLFDESKITGLFGFENRKQIFEGVDSRFKFVVLSFEKGEKTESFPAAFMRHDVNELDNFPQHGASEISVDFIKKQSPESLSISEIKNDIEFGIMKKMLRFSMLNDSKGFDIELGTEFNMTTDSHLFNLNLSNESLILFEGKMIHQFQSNFSEPRYWINIEKGRIALLGNIKDQNQMLNYQKYRIVYRAIAASTNERTMISTILPQNSFFGHSLNQVSNLKTYQDMVLLVVFLNSFCLDGYLRNTVSANLTMPFIYQLPVPRLNPQDRWYSAIVSRAARLICTTGAFAALWEEVMGSAWSEAKVATQEHERNPLRAELDGIIAHIYGLTEAEFAYILSTFPIVAQAQKEAALKAFKEVGEGRIKEGANSDKN